MTMPTDQAPDPTAAPQGGTGGQPATTTEDWKSRFDGLRGRHQQAVEEAKTQAQTFAAQIKALQDQLAAKAADFETVAHDRDQLKSKYDPMAAEHAQLKAKTDRLELVAREFPDLITLEAQGLLPPGTGEELKQKLALLKGSIQATGSQLAAQKLSGVTPPAGQKPDSKTSDQLFKDALAAYKAGQMDDYNRLMTDYYKASAS